MHKQLSKILGLYFDILVPAARTPETPELEVGDSPLSVRGMVGENVVIKMGVNEYEEGRGGERVLQYVNT